MRVLYNGDVVLTQEFSDFEAFVESHVYHGDLTEACLKGPSFLADSTNNWLLALYVIVGLIVLALLVLGVYCSCRKRGGEGEG